MKLKSDKTDDATRRKSLPVQSRSMTDMENDIFARRKSLRDMVTVIYGTKKTKRERDFKAAMWERAKWKYLYRIVLITLWVSIASHSNQFMIVFQHRKMCRCRMSPEMEQHFTFMQLLNLTVSKKDNEHNQYCRYDKRNYSGYIEKYGFDYDSIKTAISNSPTAKIVYCKDVVKMIKPEMNNIGDVINVDDDYDLYCTKRYLRQILNIIMKYGQITMGIPVGVLGDYYGRRIAFIVSAVTFTVGMLLTLCPVITIHICGRYFMGISHLLVCTVYVIAMEDCDKIKRQYLGMPLFLGIAAAKGIEYVLYITIKRWRTIVLINLSFAFIMLGSTFFVNESVRWMYFRGKKQSAYKFLGEDRPNLPDRLENPSLATHFKNFNKPLFRKRIIIHFVMIWCTSSVVFLNRKFTRQMPNVTMRILLDSGVFMALGVIATYLSINFAYGRVTSGFITLAIITVSGAIVMVNPYIDRLIIQICLVLSLTFSEVNTFLTFYVLSELYPNDFRFTAYGICSVAHGISAIIHYHSGSYSITYSSLHYSLIFAIPGVSLAIGLFLQETRGYGIPDTPREALNDKTYLRIIKQMTNW